MRPELDVDAGETRTYRLAIHNGSDEQALVNISLADFQLNAEGVISYHPAASTQLSNASWVEVAAQVDVPPTSTQTVPVTIEVPRHAEAGTYSTLLLVQPVDAVRTDQQDIDEGVRTTVAVNVRFGVTLLTHVGQPNAQRLTFGAPQVTMIDDSGARSFSLAIENPGRFLVSSRVWLELYDQRGNMVTRVEGGELRVYPQSKRRKQFGLGTLENQTYQAVIIADAGDDAVFGVRYDLEVGSD